MHPKNRYQGFYDLDRLAKVVPALREYTIEAHHGGMTLDFGKPEAVRLLNKALLMADFGLQFWDIPQGNLVPGVPGRLDYIHVLNDLLQDVSKDKKAKKITGLDIGTGASLVYPILGAGSYGWSFVASDTDEKALRCAEAITKFNKRLQGKVDLRRQPQPANIFQGIIRPNDHFAFTMCNPPFFISAEAAEQASALKWKNLGKDEKAGFSFGGQSNELWTKGGEPAFLRKMISESSRYARQVGWFTTLVSQKGYLKIADNSFRQNKPTEKRVIELTAGNKIRRVLAWRF
jgi:23S rRNA (adenine1618-N6)-methyltransferase